MSTPTPAAVAPPSSVRLVISVIVCSLTRPGRPVAALTTSEPRIGNGCPSSDPGRTRFGETVPGTLLRWATPGMQALVRRISGTADVPRVLRPSGLQREQVALVLHPLEDLLEAQVLQRERVLGTRLDLVPRARRRDHRQLPPAQ